MCCILLVNINFLFILLRAITVVFQLFEAQSSHTVFTILFSRWDYFLLRDGTMPVSITIFFVLFRRAFELTFLNYFATKTNYKQEWRHNKIIEIKLQRKSGEETENKLESLCVITPWDFSGLQWRNVLHSVAFQQNVAWLTNWPLQEQIRYSSFKK